MTIDFITIPANSMEESVDFYTKVLGFKVVQRFSPQERIEIAFLTDDKGGKIELIKRPGSFSLETCPVSLGFRVDDMDAVLADLEKYQVPIVMGPKEMGKGTVILQAQDPSGMGIGFVKESP